MDNENKYNEINDKLNKLNTDILTKKAKRDLLLNKLNIAKENKNKSEEELETYNLVQILFQKTSDYARKCIKIQIEDMVSEALGVVFSNNYKLIIDITPRGSQPFVKFFLNDGNTIIELEKPDYNTGGGVIDVISQSLRLIIGELEGNKGVLLIDEAGKHISKEYSTNFAYFLKEYANKFKRQIILITHNYDLAQIGDKSIQIINRNGISEVAYV